MYFGILYVAPPRCWLSDGHIAFHGNFYLFRNKPGIRPGRWGFGLWGLIEIGSRNPGNRIGVWLKRVGLWPF